MPPPIRFTKESWEILQRLAESAYPFEGCGLLLGPLAAEKIATRVVALKNTLRDQGRGRFDFTFSPEEFMTAERAAENDKLDVVGIYHTHPDHPPRPSQTDEGQPMLAGWVNVIAAVHGGKFREAKAWWREDDTQSFVETALHPPENP
jgi:proteasome lid subunit RPN8/RPN11